MWMNEEYWENMAWVEKLKEDHRETLDKYMEWKRAKGVDKDDLMIHMNVDAQILKWVKKKTVTAILQKLIKGEIETSPLVKH